VIDALLINPADVETAEWVRLKCQFGCGGYGLCLVCPPFTPTPQKMRQILDSYKRAILIHCKPDADIKAIVAKIENVLRRRRSIVIAERAKVSVVREEAIIVKGDAGRGVAVVRLGKSDRG